MDVSEPCRPFFFSGSKRCVEVALHIGQTNPEEVERHLRSSLGRLRRSNDLTCSPTLSFPTLGPAVPDVSFSFPGLPGHLPPLPVLEVVHNDRPSVHLGDSHL